MTSTPYPLSTLTVVLGPPLHHTDAFADFQQRARRGEAVADHAWAGHEHEALDALTHRDGTIRTHTVLETLLRSVLEIAPIIADVDRQWVRHADGQLYAAVSFCSEDVRPRAAGNTVHDPALVDALNAVTQTIAQLDGRVWIEWSRRTWYDDGDPSHISRTTELVRALGALTTDARPLSDDIPIDLVDELRVAIAHGRALADTPLANTPLGEGRRAHLVRELRSLRHLDPLRVEWARIAMDAFYLGALELATVHERVRGNDRAGLAYLYLGTERTARIKAQPEISPRFRGEIAAKTLMTAYALERLAPEVSQQLAAVMGTDAPLQNQYTDPDT